MKVLSLSLDKTIAYPHSKASKRAVTYGVLIDLYTIIVNASSSYTKLSDNVDVFGVSGINKFFSLNNIHNKAQEILQKKTYDVITVQDPYYVGFVGTLLANKFKLGLEIQVHGFEKLNWLRKIIAKYVLSRADSVRVVSKRLEKELIYKFNVKSSKITVVSIYTEPHEFLQTNKDNNTFIFLTIGRLVPVKNIELQIKAFSEIVKKYPKSELWIVGVGSEEKKLRARSEKLKDKIKFLGSQRNLSSLYGQADTFLLTSNYEGWGLVVIEAAYYKLPIIMTDVGVAGEIIQDGKSGIVIPVNDEKYLINSMDRILTDSKLRTSLGEDAYKKVQCLPNKSQTMDLYKKSWNIAIANNKQP